MQFIEQLEQRYAIKNFDPDSIVYEGNIDLIKEAIRLAPSAWGLQPYHVTVVSNKELKEKLCAASYNQSQVKDCSHFFIFSARTDYEALMNEYVETGLSIESGTKEQLSKWKETVAEDVLSMSKDEALSWSTHQSYIALGFGLSACAILGIGSCPMEGFEPEKFQEILGLSESTMPCVVMAVGYRIKDDMPRKKVRQSSEQLFTEIV